MSAIRLTSAQCDGFGVTWGPGIGPPPAGCGMAPAGGGGAAGGRGGGATTADGVTGAGLRGTIGTATDGNVIYGPFEAGFPANRLCGQHPEIPGGLDTQLAAFNVNYHCGATNTELFNDCGGHANPFHYHEYFTCLYNNAAASGHSSRAGDIDNAARGTQGLYGKFEAAGVLPKLDACNGHFGATPDSNGEVVYHYHVTSEAPFSVGCLGPTADDRPVTVAQCRAAYSTCGDGDEAEFEWVDRDGVAGVVLYDPDCPCWDADESNVGNAELDLTGVDGAGIGATSAVPSTPAPTTLPLSTFSVTSKTMTSTTTTTTEITTTATTTAPTTLAPCTDSADWHQSGKSKRTCAWIAKKPTNWRCNRADADGVTGNTACPAACGTCQAPAPRECTDSPDWVRDGKPKHDCAWVTMKPTNWRCNRVDAAGVAASDACPVACGACPATGAAVSSEASSSAGTTNKDAASGSAGSAGSAGAAVAGAVVVVAVGLVAVVLRRSRSSSRAAAAAELGDEPEPQPQPEPQPTDAFTLTADGNSVRPISVRRENPAFRGSVDLSPV